MVSFLHLKMCHLYIATYSYACIDATVTKATYVVIYNTYVYIGHCHGLTQSHITKLNLCFGKQALNNAQL